MPTQAEAGPEPSHRYPEPLLLYLVRHGQTEWSRAGRHTGRTDVPLDAQGEAEARALAGPLRGISFTQVLTSPLQRARQTCILAGLGDHAVVEPDLLEWNYGDYEGLRSAEIHAGRPGWNLYRDGAPNGETPQQVSDRTDRLIERLHQHAGPVGVFSHGHFGCCLAARWIVQPIVNARHFILGTASLSILGYHPKQPGLRIIQGWNAAPTA